MSTQPPVNPASFDAKLASVQRTITSLRTERADKLALYASKSHDQQLNDELAAIEREITTAEGEANRLTEAKAEAARRFTASANAAYVAQVEADAQKVVELAADQAAAAEKIFKHIKALAPLLGDYQRISRERADLIWAVMRAGRAGGLSAQAWAAQLDAGAFAWLIEAAFRMAGVGAPGVTGGVVVPPAPRLPGRDGRRVSAGGRSVLVPGGQDHSHDWLNTDDPVSLMRAEVERHTGKLSTALRSAVESARELHP